jgi:PAS domain S-box-containing protein
MVRSGYFFLLGVGCLLGLWIVYRAWRNRENTEARFLMGFAGATVVWTGGTILIGLSDSFSAKLFWLRVAYIGTVLTPVSFVILALEYTGYRRHLTTSTIGALLVLSGCFLVLIWTNSLHGLFWADADLAASAPTGLNLVPAMGFGLFAGFAYVLLLVGSIRFAVYATTAPHLYRSQSVLILGGVAVPWVASVPYVFQIMEIDLTPIALSVLAAALWGAISRYRLTDLSPIALRTVFGNIAAGVVVLDRRDRVVDVNGPAERLLGEPDNPIGQPVRMVLSDDLYNTIRGEDDPPEVVALEDDLDEEDGPRYVDVRVRPIETDRGRKEGRLLIVNDVTDRHRRQQKLQRQNNRLEEFTSVVSHDLRNPLNVAMGNVTLAQDECGSDYLDRAEQALGRMEALIDDLLALAHGGADMSDPEPVDLTAVVRDAWESVDTKQAKLVNQAEKSIQADRSRLQQLVENLIRNAVEHGGESVTITAGERDDGFYVADDGPGIPEGQRGSVFGMGYSTAEDGTGFGLNIVKQVADAHGWAIRATDGSDGGARFEFSGVDVAG